MWLGLAVLAQGEAAVKTRPIDYVSFQAAMEGHFASDDTLVGPRPGILVVHDWMGFGPYAKSRAEQLAQLGYAAMAVDIYGKGVRPKDAKEAGKVAGQYKADRPLMRERILAALAALKEQPEVDRGRVGAIGYCFGGTVALELMRSGAPVAGVVSFHGGLETKMPAKTGEAKGKVLVCHGADDPFVTAAEVATFEEEMRAAGVDWQLIKYSGAVHSFTNPHAGNDPSKGAAYHFLADKRSWEAMKLFFQEVFR